MNAASPIDRACSLAEGRVLLALAERLQAVLAGTYLPRRRSVEPVVRREAAHRAARAPWAGPAAEPMD